MALTNRYFFFSDENVTVNVEIDDKGNHHISIAKKMFYGNDEAVEIILSKNNVDLLKKLLEDKQNETVA